MSGARRPGDNATQEHADLDSSVGSIPHVDRSSPLAHDVSHVLPHRRAAHSDTETEADNIADRVLRQPGQARQAGLLASCPSGCERSPVLTSATPDSTRRRI